MPIILLSLERVSFMPGKLSRSFSYMWMRQDWRSIHMQDGNNFAATDTFYITQNVRDQLYIPGYYSTYKWPSLSKAHHRYSTTRNGGRCEDANSLHISPTVALEASYDIRVH